VLSHRFIWEHINGKIPDDKEVHHECVNPSCSNIDHLRLVTDKEHKSITSKSIGFKNAQKTQCPQKHEYAGDNLYRFPNGSRACRECSRESWRRNYKPHPKVPKTECSKGHPLSGDNLIMDSHDQRRCRKCQNYNARMYYKRKQEALGKKVTPNFGKTHCKHGHEFTPENTRIKKTGSRDCRTCDRKRALRYYYNKKSKISEE